MRCSITWGLSAVGAAVVAAAAPRDSAGWWSGYGHLLCDVVVSNSVVYLLFERPAAAAGAGAGAGLAAAQPARPGGQPGGGGAGGPPAYLNRIHLVGVAEATGGDAGGGGGDLGGGGDGADWGGAM